MDNEAGLYVARASEGQPEFLTDVASVRAAIRAGKPYYVYVLHRPDGRPFYVGKGVNLRVLDHEAEARNTTRLTHKLNVIRSLFRLKVSIHYHLDSFFEDEAEALARERQLIQIIGRHDLGTGPLTNQTDGGEGTSNPSEESRQRRRESLWGDAADPERQIANNYFRKLATVESVTLKPTSTWRSATALRRNRTVLKMTSRQAATLAASAIQNRILLEPGALIPRRLHVEGLEFIIENGVGNDVRVRRRPRANRFWRKADRA
ncbi:GIY-YIG nuclease family protein [Bradyrhizobium sp. CCBAU 53338]|uniref:GIY-YIG nuclease family protein n=1 Tax=Bradyrhizobium sp. CCBAU 53338 TaxID=1325111 RepID=UPI00188AE540|nr:GIY-YIG nuclease family protein [Bradyrhizobium sp. CCBAU 53338]QOZ55450.1 GIY-YIG nuclease family protein [Bradyrhizobium sp. CCBAU 53338]